MDEQLKRELNRLQDQVDALRSQVDQTAEVQEKFGRPRYLIWGELLEELVWEGEADVQLMAKEEKPPGSGNYEWVEKLIMEDVRAPYVMPEGSCLPAMVDDHRTRVVVAWFPLDQWYYVYGAETCPTFECGEGSSS